MGSTLGSEAGGIGAWASGSWGEEGTEGYDYWVPAGEDARVVDY